jgi:hypothetical protein
LPARQPLFWSLDKDGILHALALLERAIARDPQYGPALGWAAMCRLHMDINGWSEDLERDNNIGHSDTSRRRSSGSAPVRGRLSRASCRHGLRAGHSSPARRMLRRSPRALPVGPAASDGRDRMTATRRLAAILAADVIHCDLTK